VKELRNKLAAAAVETGSVMSDATDGSPSSAFSSHETAVRRNLERLEKDRRGNIASAEVAPPPLLASPSELLASPSELLASPSELLVSPSELLASPRKLTLLASPSHSPHSPSPPHAGGAPHERENTSSPSSEGRCLGWLGVSAQWGCHQLPYYMDHADNGALQRCTVRLRRGRR
jgi:hypothetical protein